MFANNQLSLSGLMLLSEDSQKKISKIVGDKPAYFVGGHPGFQDVLLGVKMNLPFLTGDPALNLKFCSAFRVKKFLHEQGLPYMAFSQKIAKEKDFEQVFAKALIANPQYSNWKFEIDGEQGGKGSATICVDSISIVQAMRDNPNEEDRKRWLPELTDYLTKFVSGYAVTSCPKLFYRFHDYKEVLIARNGFVEAIPKGKTFTIGVCLFLSPSGKLV